MDIKIKGTTRAGILAFDLNDPTGAEQMEEAMNATALILSLQEFMNKLRTIRKYDSVPEVRELAVDANLKDSIMNSEEYYRILLLQILEEYDVLKYL